MPKTVDMTLKRAERESFLTTQTINRHISTDSTMLENADVLMKDLFKLNAIKFNPIDQSNTQSHMYRNSDVLKAIKRLFLYASYTTAHEEKDCKQVADYVVTFGGKVQWSESYTEACIVIE